MESMARVLPLPIEVGAGKGKSVVASRHTVGIDHGNYSHFESVCQLAGFFA